MAVLLDARSTQTCKTILVDGCLPGQEFLGRQLVALARFLETEKATANGGYDLSLAPDDPSARICRREIGNRQGAPVRPNDVLDTRSNQIGHSTLYTTQKTNHGQFIATALKIDEPHTTPKNPMHFVVRFGFLT
jgi:hypothetical protein